MRRIILMFITNFYKLPYLFFGLLKLSNTVKYDRFRRYAFLHRNVVRANRGGRVSIDAHGLELLPKETGYIMFPNHQGMYDVLSILEVHELPFSTVMKKETQDIFLLRKVSEVFGAEIIDRDDVRQSLTVIKSMTERVKNGENFVVFAEGTRSKKGNELLEFKGGTFKSAMNAKCPIVPVALIDSFKPFDEKSIKKVTVQLHFLEPLCYNDYKGMKSVEIANLVHDRIEQKIKEVLGNDA